MKKLKIRIVSVCAAAAMITAMLASCADRSLGSAQNNTSKPGSTPETENVTTLDIDTTAEPQEGETTAGTTQGVVNFVIGEDGKIAGSPSDYNIDFRINGLTFTAAEYENDMETYVNQLYDLLAEDAPYKEDRLLAGKAHTSFDYAYDIGLANLLAFTASAGSRTIAYGTQGDHPNTDTSVVDFEMNGIRLGDNIEKVVECYGAPTSELSWNCPTDWNGPDEAPTNGCEGHSYLYQFEDGSEIDIRFLGEGEIIQLSLRYPETAQQ